MRYVIVQNINDYIDWSDRVANIIITLKETENHLKSPPKTMSEQMILMEKLLPNNQGKNILQNHCNAQKEMKTFINIWSEWHNPIINIIYKYT